MTSLDYSLFKGAQKIVLDLPDGVNEFGFTLFDNQTLSPSLAAGRLSDRWFRDLRNLVAPSLPTKSNLGGRVKIAILDSGIDEHEVFISSSQDRITSLSFLPDDSSTEDLLGHGTHTAALLLKIAPEAEIYVARITKSGSLHDANIIEKAIRHAITVWTVDIITMSFGFPSLVEELDPIQNAINAAYNAKIMFAAARNDGGNGGIAYPANQDQVICVSSTDGYRNPSKFNPSPVLGKNFSVLGEDVLSSWPEHLSKEMQRQSGTSYATPIAAALAAIVLDFVLQESRAGDKYKVSKLRTPQGMKAVFSLTSEERGGFQYLVPWKLFDKRNVNVYGSIMDVLK